jgi:hypothetical protein
MKQEVLQEKEGDECFTQKATLSLQAADGHLARASGALAM